jgi:hypothetical protein
MSTNRTPNKSKVPTDFTVTRTFVSARLRATPRTVQAFRCNNTKRPSSRIRFGPGTLAAAKLDPTQPATIARLQNGMWAVIPHPDGYKLSPNTAGDTYSMRTPLLCHFSLPAELLHGMWVFPAETFRETAQPKPEAEPAASQ